MHCYLQRNYVNQNQRNKTTKAICYACGFSFPDFTKNGNSPATYIVFLLLGSFIGWLLYKNVKIRADKVKKLILVPGSIIPLILIIFAFCRGYFIGFETAVHPELLKTYWFAFTISATSGLTSGIFISRTAVYLYKYINAENEDFSKMASSTSQNNCGYSI